MMEDIWMEKKNYISDEDKAFLLQMTPHDLSVTNITRLFGWTAKKIDGKFTRIPPRFKTTDWLILKDNEYINQKGLETTVGSVLFNKLYIENKVEEAVPNHFFDGEVTNKQFNKLLGYIEKGVMNGVLKVQPNLLDFLYAYEFYSMKLVTVFSPSYTPGLFQSNQNIRNKKKEALANQKTGNLDEMVAIEDDVVAYAKKELKDDPGMTLFDSGARGSFENDYKNMCLMVGAIKNESNGEYEFIKHGYLEGLKKEDWVGAGNIVVNSQYPKSVGTAVGGYMTKQFYAAYQALTIDPNLEDCGTKQCLEFVLTEDLFDDFEFQYIKMPNGNHELLTDDNKDKFIGKKIKMRSPMFCASDRKCHLCMGDLPRKLGIENVGLVTGRISNTMLAKKMKLMHVGKIKFDEVDLDTLLI